MMYFDIFVVIRFQICIFDILNTAHSCREFKKKRL